MKNFQMMWPVLAVVVLIGGAFALTRSNDTAHVVPGDGSNEATKPALQHVHGFAVDITNPDRLLIATHHGLLQFMNGTLSQIGTVADDLMGFTPHPTEASVFFSSGHPIGGGNLGFQKSTDAGLTWKKVSDGLHGPVDFHSMTVSVANPDLVYGHFGNLQRSMDGGNTWEVTKATIQPFSLSTDPVNEEVVYAASQDGVLISEDRGDTWKSLSLQLAGGAVSVFALSPENKYVLVFSQTLGGLGKSTDGGLTWEKINESFNGETLTFIAYSKTTPSIVYALSQSNSIYKSADEGVTWTKIK